MTEREIKQWLQVKADALEESIGLELSFRLMWELAAMMQERWEKSETFPRPADGEAGKKAQTALANFAIARLVSQHRQLHDAACRYVEIITGAKP